MLLYALLLAAQAHAATPTTPTPPTTTDTTVVEPDVVKYKAVTALDFTDVKVHAEMVKPEYTLLKSRSKTKFRNLIELRANFRPELSKSQSAIR